MVSVDHGELDKVNVHQVLNTDTQELTLFQDIIISHNPCHSTDGGGGNDRKRRKTPNKILNRSVRNSISNTLVLLTGNYISKFIS